MDNKYVSLSNLIFYTEKIKNEIQLCVQKNLYGIVDGTIQTMSNDMATTVADYGFYKHTSITFVDYPSVTKIGNYSFYQCESLMNINAPSTTQIGNFAFKGCSSLIYADFENVLIAGNGVFDECINLSSVNFTNLQRVPHLMFRKCKNLTTVDLPVATSIGTQAFYDSGISSLTLSSNTMCILENIDAFYFTPIEEGTGHIYVPAAMIDTYKNATGWSIYADQIMAIT